MLFCALSAALSRAVLVRGSAPARCASRASAFAGRSSTAGGPPPEHPLLHVLRDPARWYPAARALRRRIVLHVGPTNSGKTHAALAALAAAPCGVYAAPLRLLAWEVCERLRAGAGGAAPLAVSLVTGQEVDVAPGARHVCSTVEMTELASPVDVGVLDEVQCLGDGARGWAWTRLLLGLPARELHLCGDAAAVPLVRALCAATGDAVEIREYTRLAPLAPAPAPVRKLAELRRGDCVVAFSRRELFAWKARIERGTGLSCGVVYGALPPAVRRDEARRFNTVDAAGRTDVLVATDAIGMGLNLAIERVLFTTTSKFDGISRRPLLVAEIKQIAGRAGRFGGEYAQTGGAVAACDVDAHAAVRRALRQATPEVRRAGLQPQLEHLELYAASLVDADVMAALHARADASADAAETPPLPASEVLPPPPPPPQDLAAQLALYERRFVSENSAEVAAAAARCAAALPWSELLEAFIATAAGAWPGADDGRGGSGRRPAPPPPPPPPRISAGGAPRSRGAALLPPLPLTLPPAMNAGAFFMCDARDLVEVARALDDIPLAFRARYTFVVAPVDVDNPLVMAALRRYARHYARRGRVHVGVALPTEVPASAAQLQELETLHACFSLYTYLAWRFPVEFADLDVAMAGAERTEELIAEGLRTLSAAALRAHEALQLQQSPPPTPPPQTTTATQRPSSAATAVVNVPLPAHLAILLRRLEARALDILSRTPLRAQPRAAARRGAAGLAHALIARLPPPHAPLAAAAAAAAAQRCGDLDVAAVADGIDALLARRHEDRHLARLSAAGAKRKAAPSAADDAHLRSIAGQLRRLGARARAAASRDRARRGRAAAAPANDDSGDEAAEEG